MTERNNQNPPRRQQLDEMAGQDIGQDACTAEWGRIRASAPGLCLKPALAHAGPLSAGALIKMA